MAVYLVRKNAKKRLFSSFEQTNAVTRFVGLMFRRSFSKQSKPILFTGNGRIAIHSLFCPAFDAVFLNKSGNIVDIFKVEPWTPPVVSNAFFLFEMPSGSAVRFSLKKGDKLQWKN